ncbi:unnamed protein product, partial [Rotaria magnacalcarata]
IGEYDKKKKAEQKLEEAKEIERRKAELASKLYTIIQDEKPEEPEPPKKEKEKKKEREDHHHRHKSNDDKKR